MQKIDLSFIKDILDAHIREYQTEYDREFPLCMHREWGAKIDALNRFKRHMKDFIQEVNKLS